MSKKNRSTWQVKKPRTDLSAAEAAAVPSGSAVCPSDFFTNSPISPAQLLANRANAQLSTGPRSEIGKAASSKNAVKSALTGRSVLLPSDDRDQYAALLAEFQQGLKPVGQFECELVQIIVDCYWRLRRIQELEYTFYIHGQRQFEEAFAIINSHFANAFQALFGGQRIDLPKADDETLPTRAKVPAWLRRSRTR